MEDPLFERVLELLYPGDDGISKFVLDMIVNYRDVERWLNGETLPPACVWRELHARVRDLGERCDELEIALEIELNRLLVP